MWMLDEHEENGPDYSAVLPVQFVDGPRIDYPQWEKEICWELLLDVVWVLTVGRHRPKLKEQVQHDEAWLEERNSRVWGEDDINAEYQYITFCDVCDRLSIIKITRFRAHLQESIAACRGHEEVPRPQYLVRYGARALDRIVPRRQRSATILCAA